MVDTMDIVEVVASVMVKLVNEDINKLIHVATVNSLASCQAAPFN